MLSQIINLTTSSCLHFPEMIKSLTMNKVFFGHQSLGSQIVNRIQAIIKHYDQIRDVLIIKTSESTKFKKHGIYHMNIGRNRSPKSKCDAFKAFLIKDNRGEKFDIAFFKFCFVDITRHTDIKDVMNYYVDTVDSVKKHFPDLTIVHITTPLTVHAWGLKGWLKNLLVADLDNVKRNQFNQLLLETYKNQDPIFDLAKVESTKSDSKRSFFTYKGQTYYSLCRQYSSDGGHLNEQASELAAVELLHVLINAASFSK